MIFIAEKILDPDKFLLNDVLQLQLIFFSILCENVF